MAPKINNLYCLDDYCEAKFGSSAENIYFTVKKQKNGATYVYDNNGNFLAKYGQERPPKRIYTIEAAAVSKKTGNTFRLRYK